MLVDINCPVELLEYQLYRSKKTGKVYCSFRFNNISEKNIPNKPCNPLYN